MGYTHYFKKVSDTRDDDLRFEMFAIGAGRIIDYAMTYDNIEIADAMGEKLGAFEITKDFVSFNGYGDGAHETFSWDRQGNGFNFCKTAYKTYDVVVTACLIHLKDVYGDAVEISSDGDWSDWRDGARLYNNVTGLPAENPMTQEVGV
jgi:hypothetical protein